MAVLTGCRPHGLEALRQGDVALRAGRTPEAISLLERAAADLPSDARVWNHLGLAYHAAGRDNEALKAHLRALEHNRGFMDAWFNVGVRQFDQGRWLEAERALRTYLGAEAGRTNAAAWRTLGLAQLESGQLDLAEQNLANAVKLAPRDVEAWNGVGLIHVARRRPREALKTFNYLAQIAPDYAPARLNAAVTVHQHLNDRRGAIPFYRAYLALNPPNAAEVQTLVTQLEQSLQPIATTNAPVALAATNPPPKLSTNLVSRATNAPPRTVTNTPAPLAKTLPTNPPPVTRSQPAVTNPPVKPPAAVAKRPEPEPEVVRVATDPKFAVARDVKPEPVPVTTQLVPAPTPADPVRAPAIPADASVNQAIILPPELESSPDKRGFWTRANPANWKWRRANPSTWFDASEAGGTNRTPSSDMASGTRTASRGTLALPTNTTPVVATPPKPKPVVPHYSPKVPAQFTAGDRVRAQTLFNEGINRHSQRDFAGAATLYEQAAQADPSFPAAPHNLALVALELDDTTKALGAAEAAAALQPDALPARQLFAVALQRANYPADAAEQWERIVAATPNDAQAHLTLAGLYGGPLGDAAQARAHYLRVLALDPNHPQAPAIRVWLAGNP